MVKRNYKFEKRQKDLAKSKKKEEKRLRKLARKQADNVDSENLDSEEEQEGLEEPGATDRTES